MTPFALKSLLDLKSVAGKRCHLITATRKRVAHEMTPFALKNLLELECVAGKRCHLNTSKIDKIETAMSKHLDELHAENFYHVFNRTNNREPLFLDDEDRRYFLEKYKQYVSAYVDTYTFCLMGNHFHLVVRVKSVTFLQGLVQKVEPKDRTVAQKKFLEMKEDIRSTHELMSNQFNRMFTAYAMYFNKKHQRSGNLFYRPFKRVAVKNEGHFTWLMYYVHSNPKKHKVQADFQNYAWSSYQAFLSDSPTMLKRKEVLEWFGGKEGFLKFHDTQQPEDSKFDYLVIED